MTRTSPLLCVACSWRRKSRSQVQRHPKNDGGNSIFSLAITARSCGFTIPNESSCSRLASPIGTMSIGGNGSCPRLTRYPPRSPASLHSDSLTNSLAVLLRGLRNSGRLCCYRARSCGRSLACAYARMFAPLPLLVLSGGSNLARTLLYRSTLRQKWLKRRQKDGPSSHSRALSSPTVRIRSFPPHLKVPLISPINRPPAAALSNFAPRM